MKDFLNQDYFSNSLREYLFAILIVLLAIAIIQVLKRFVVIKVYENSEDQNKGERIAKSIKRFIIPLLYLGSIYLAVESLTFPESIYKVIRVLYIILVTWFVVRFIITLLDISISKYFEKTREEEEQRKLKPVISFLNFLIWIIGLLFLLDNLDFQISTIVAGLGIGGIAVALAAQTILGDLFSYFVIFFDKPFEIGDFIIFDDKLGIVEKIGIKTTKVRCLSGELLIVSNSNLTGSRVHNYKKMERRRVVFTIGVVYQTKAEKLKEIPGLIKEIIESHELATFDRSHFKSYGDFSLNFESVYYVETSDYTKYMDTQEAVNMKIFEEFEKREIEFAYPTQTLYLNKFEPEK